jgi:hypothetical protein
VPNAKVIAPTQRPLAGPVVPLTGGAPAAEELLGAARAKPPAIESGAARVLIRGQGAAAPTGRADDFSWPRNGGAEPAPGPAEPAPALPVGSRPGEVTTTGDSLPPAVQAGRSSKSFAAQTPAMARRVRTAPRATPSFFDLFR